MRPILVHFDGTEPIPAWTTGETWNGFAVPLFDDSQIDAAIEALRAAGLTVTRAGWSIMCTDPDMGETTYEATSIDGHFYWSFAGLTWNEAEAC